MYLYHCTTLKKAKKYKQTGYIRKPVRGFTNIKSAMFWCMKTNRTIIYKIKCCKPYKLPDHHNKFGEAWWNDDDIFINDIECVVSTH